MQAKIAILPVSAPILISAVERSGASVTDDAAGADAIIWLDPRRPDLLQEILRTSAARWVQLPLAGIENFVLQGVIDDSRAWTCAKEIYGAATAELAFGLTVAAARNFHLHMRTNTWFREETERKLSGTTALVVGTGGIGSAYAKYAKAFDVRLLAVNRSGRSVDWAERTVTSESMIDLVADADWIVVAAAATPETKHLINRAVLERMKPDAWLINVGRGTLVDTEALVDALAGRAIGGAALDVTDPEPLPDEHPLWKFLNVIITSHTANTFRMALEELAKLIERNIGHFARGEPLEGVVDPSLGY